MNCQVCGATNAMEIGEVEYYSNFGWKIYHCGDCMCRFTRHDDSIYDWLHTQAASSYGIYRELADKCRIYFNNSDIQGLKCELSKTEKYSFIIDTLECHEKSAKILEVGCSRGYLASYFILSGYDITGVDVSADAIRYARESYGNHFMVASTVTMGKFEYYDAIYHVGTIGCVKEPVAFTHNLLRMLKPGGQLIFNAPNVMSCYLEGQLWLDAAPPPDLVSLFRPGIWQKQFAAVANVVEKIGVCSPDESLKICLQNTFKREWVPPEPIPLESSINDYKGSRMGTRFFSDKLWANFEKCVLKIGRVTHANTIITRQPSPFGFYVTMTKK